MAGRKADKAARGSGMAAKAGRMLKANRSRKASRLAEIMGSFSTPDRTKKVR